MCIEAETLCAMLASKPEQVVLIGDHKQLRPVIRCKEARELGLGISMFERFSDQAHMLKIQYRMVSNSSNTIRRTSSDFLTPRGVENTRQS